MQPAEISALERALQIAGTEGVPYGPNPRVGAVILAPTGDVIAEGWHRGAGTAHAEVDALTQAAHSGRDVRGATMVVTLEPCHHTGRTGPCSQAIHEAGIARVVYAMSDPHPVAAGGGSWLRAQGVDVRADVDVERATAINEPWVHAVRRQRPWVTYKVAMTLDGRAAAADGTSQWISSDESRRDAHRLRSRVQAIVVGTGTALVDDPALTVRDVPTQNAPVRVVVGQRTLAPSARVLDASAPTLVIAERDPHMVLAQLGAEGVVHVLLEGGPTIAAAWLRAGVVDEVIAYVAPSILGAGPAAIGDLGIATLADALRGRLTEVTRCGPDLRLTVRWGAHPGLEG